MHYKYIFFDLDGTVLDTNELILSSFQHIFQTELQLHLPDEVFLQYFGEPLATTMERYARSKAHAEELREHYLAYSRARHDDMVRVFDGIPECLSSLNNMGAILALVTSKTRASAIHGLQRFDLDKYFHSFVAAEDTKGHKPGPEPVLKALALTGGKPEEAIMVGDSRYDIEAAQNAGVDTILVDWSLAQSAQGHSIPANYFVTKPSEILDIVKM